jgi:hypothetical protein
MSRSLGLAASLLAASLGGCGDTFLLSINTDGEIHILIRTDGEDADGWRIRVDGVDRAVPSAGTLTVDALSEGAHLVELNGVAHGCRVEGANPRQVRVTGASPASVAFDVVCTR